MNKATCCFGCEKRQYNCHSECGDYKAMKEKNEAEKQKKKPKDSVFLDYSHSKWNKVLHNKHIQTKRK